MTVEIEGGGRLNLWEEGDKVFFRCEFPLKTDGIYKVWLGGEGGELLLGTLVPEGNRLLLCRIQSRGELQRSGCWPVREARCVRSYAFPNRERDGWYCEEHPEALVDEETGQLGQWRPMLCRKEENALLLACPLRKETPLPLSHLFCLAAAIKIRGEVCLVWHFDRKGKPYLPD